MTAIWRSQSQHSVFSLIVLTVERNVTALDPISCIDVMLPGGLEHCLTEISLYAFF